MNLVGKLQNRSLWASVLMIVLLSLAWFLISKRVNAMHMEAVDPSNPATESNHWLLNVVHAVVMFPLMPLLPMQWLYAHFGAGVATRVVVEALILNSLFWGCLLFGLFKLVTKFRHDCTRHANRHTNHATKL